MFCVGPYQSISRDQSGKAALAWRSEEYRPKITLVDTNLGPDSLLGHLCQRMSSGVNIRNHSQPSL
jgi:hypothetical protein